MPRHFPLSDAEYLDRLRARCVIDANGCWLYQGFIQRNGYGEMCCRNQNWRAHRLAYTLAKGQIHDGHDVCHTCDVKRCCNPDHLWTGPRQLNNRDTTDKGRNKNSQKTHCPHGHAYSEYGRVYEHGYKGWRRCIPCQRAKERRRAGWPDHLLFIPPVPHGYRLVHIFE